MNSKDPTLDFRFATLTDVPVLAGMNAQLIPDEGHRSTLTETQLVNRMNGWLSDNGEYRAVLFYSKVDSPDEPVAYALFRPSGEGIYLRQFFVARNCRRKGIGRAAMRLLIDDIWPGDLRLTVDALAGNEPAIEFWKAVGFQSYSVCLEMVPS